MIKSILYQLIKAELKAFRSIALSETIDLLAWVVVINIVSGFIMPLFGVPTEFILINFAGTVASSISFRAYPNVNNLVGDFHGDRTITQRLILPISPWLVFLAMIAACFLITMWISIWVLPVSLPVMGKFMSFKSISWWKFVLIFAASSWFFSVLPIFLASFIDSPRRVGKIWLRFIFPLWFLGGFQFTWLRLYESFPILALLDLLNPFIYMMEGMRVALLGPEGNLPFWIDVVMLLVLSGLCYAVGVRRLKKQLDFV